VGTGSSKAAAGIGALSKYSSISAVLPPASGASSGASAR
jgi:hypothetical protein